MKAHSLMPTSTQPNGSPSDQPKKTKLEREIEEILQRAEKDNPLPPPTPIRSRQKKKKPEEDVRSFQMPDLNTSLRRWLDTAPLLVAFIAAIIGMIVRDFSPFLATIAAIAAVVALFWPVAASFRSPKTGPKMWRGREMETYSRSEPPESITRIQEWLRRKGILK